MCICVLHVTICKPFRLCIGLSLQYLSKVGCWAGFRDYILFIFKISKWRSRIKVRCYRYRRTRRQHRQHSQHRCMALPPLPGSAQPKCCVELDGGTHPFTPPCFCYQTPHRCRRFRNSYVSYGLSPARSPFSRVVCFRFAQLSSLVEILESCQEFGFDLEAHNARTYHGLTCLLQISTEDKVTRSTVASIYTWYLVYFFLSLGWMYCLESAFVVVLLRCRWFAGICTQVALQEGRWWLLRFRCSSLEQEVELQYFLSNFWGMSGRCARYVRWLCCPGETPKQLNIFATLIVGLPSLSVFEKLILA